MCSVKFSLICFILLSSYLADALNIVIFLPGTSRNERDPLMKLAQHLAFKNHGVCTFKGTIITEPRMLVMPKLHQVRELGLRWRADESTVNQIKDIGNVHPWVKEYDIVQYQKPYWSAYNQTCQTLLDSDLMDRMKKDGYDVALVYKGNPCHLGVVHALRIPFIYYDMDGFSDEILFASGSPAFPSAIPSSDSTFSNEMTLTERLQNVFLLFKSYAPFTNITELGVRFNDQYRLMDRPISETWQNDYEIKRRFNVFPDVTQIKKEAAMYFINSDPLLEFTGRTVMPNVAYVGGAHFDYPKPLFQPWNETVLEYPDGLIICQLGMVANTTSMPLHMLTSLIGALSYFDTYRIFIVIRITENAPMYNKGHIPGFDSSTLPAHINLTYHVPQFDLLNSGHVKALITNGGMKSIMEAVYGGVPMLGIPLYGINYNNLRKAEAKGIAEIIDKKDLTVQNVRTTLEKLLSDKKYQQKARELAVQFKDRPLGPFDNLVFWLEYVARHRRGPAVQIEGAPIFGLVHFVFVDMVAVFTVVAILTIFMIRTIFLCLCGGHSTKEPNQKLSIKKLKEKAETTSPESSGKEKRKVDVKKKKSTKTE